MDYKEAIEAGLAANVPYSEIARKIYLTYPTKAFAGLEERQYQVLNEIALFFCIPITCVQVCGSAKTGRSFHKNTDFVPGVSDLDIAIVDTSLFVRYAEIVFAASKGFSDNSQFPIRGGKSTREDYQRYLSIGVFRPDLMTVGPDRATWTSFFGRLSSKHTDLFQSISAGIYLSQTFFEGKQRSAITNYLANRPI